MQCQRAPLIKQLFHEKKNRTGKGNMEVLGKAMACIPKGIFYGLRQVLSVQFPKKLMPYYWCSKGIGNLNKEPNRSGACYKCATVGLIIYADLQFSMYMKILSSKHNNNLGSSTDTDSTV